MSAIKLMQRQHKHLFNDSNNTDARKSKGLQEKAKVKIEKSKILGKAQKMVTL